MLVAFNSSDIWLSNNSLLIVLSVVFTFIKLLHSENLISISIFDANCSSHMLFDIHGTSSTNMSSPTTVEVVGIEYTLLTMLKAMTTA
jgi:hypothetical protein